MTKAGGSIDLLQYAEVRAYLRFFPEEKKDEVVARIGLQRAAWDAAVASFGAARDAELASGKTGLTSRFGIAFARALRRLALAPPTLSSVGPLPDLGDPFAAGEGDPPPEVRRPPVDLRSTALLVSPVVSAPTPFAGKTATPTQAFKAAVAHAELVQGPAPKGPALALGGTVGLGGAAPAGVGPPPPGVPALTLAQYASLKVDLRPGGGGEAAILARYGVPPDSWPALNAYWQTRFEADPLSRMEFVRAYATYAAWLKLNAPPQGG